MAVARSDWSEILAVITVQPGPRSREVSSSGQVLRGVNEWCTVGQKINPVVFVFVKKPGMIS